MDHSKYFELGGGYMQTHIANMILDLKTKRWFISLGYR